MNTQSEYDYNNLDIEKILSNFKQYEEDGYTYQMCIVVKNKKDIENLKIEKSNNMLKNIIKCGEKIIYIDYKENIRFGDIYRK